MLYRLDSKIVINTDHLVSAIAAKDVLTNKWEVVLTLTLKPLITYTCDSEQECYDVLDDLAAPGKGPK